MQMPKNAQLLKIIQANNITSQITLISVNIYLSECIGLYP
jgi:hypothetical protein